MSFKNKIFPEKKQVSNDEDIELMLALKEGDENSFERLLDKYEKRLLNFIYRFVNNRQTAEDLTQEVFLKAYLSATNYKPTAKFSTWLYKITISLCLDYKKKRKIKTISLDKTINADEGQITREIPDSSQLTPDISIEKKQINEAIKSALLSLPANQHLALSLKIYEDKSYREIAKILGCSVSSVESIIFRARQNLKAKLTSLAG